MGAEALPPAVVDRPGWKRLLPTAANRATAAATPATATAIRPARRLVDESSGVTEAPAVVEAASVRWACSAARLALIRSTRYPGMGAGCGSADSRSRTPVGSSSQDGSAGSAGLWVIRVLTSMLGCGLSVWGRAPVSDR